LLQQNTYTFIKDEADMFVEDRFYLSFEPSGGNGLDDINASGFTVTASSQTIRITANGSAPLGDIEITDTQGRRLVSEKGISSSFFSYKASQPGIYLAGVNGFVRKVIVK
jgi:hypothetical protein